MPSSADTGGDPGGRHRPGFARCILRNVDLPGEGRRPAAADRAQRPDGHRRQLTRPVTRSGSDGTPQVGFQSRPWRERIRQELHVSRDKRVGSGLPLEQSPEADAGQAPEEGQVHVLLRHPCGHRRARSSSSARTCRHPDRQAGPAPGQQAVRRRREPRQEAGSGQAAGEHGLSRLGGEGRRRVLRHGAGDAHGARRHHGDVRDVAALVRDSHGDVRARQPRRPDLVPRRDRGLLPGAGAVPDPRARGRPAPRMHFKNLDSLPRGAALDALPRCARTSRARTAPTCPGAPAGTAT